MLVRPACEGEKVTGSESLIQDVIKANEEFYRAFESLNIERMAEIWLQDESVQVIHPGWQAKRGWDEVKDSWDTIFSNTGYMEFDITDVHVLVGGEFARVSCTENLRSVVGSEQSMGQVQATNIFLQRGERWLMVHHHGSPIFTT